MSSSASVDIRKVKSQDSMRRALLSLIAERAFDQITTRDITAAAGIGYATFYRHYDSKEVLLNDVAKQQVDDLVRDAASVLNPSDSLAVCLHLCVYIESRWELWSALVKGGAAGAIKDELINEARVIAAAWPGLDSDFPAELGIALIVSATVELIVWWVSQEQPLAAEKVADIYHRMIVAPAIAQW